MQKKIKTFLLSILVLNTSILVFEITNICSQGPFILLIIYLIIVLILRKCVEEFNYCYMYV